MEAKAIALAIPFFFALIGIELLVARRKKRALVRFQDAIASLSCGIGQQVIYLFTTVFSIAAYVWVQGRYALFHPTMASPLAWIALFVLIDHSYYWFHRASHRVSFLWAGHAVHHQSEEYNLTTALRQSWLEATLALPFYVPIALLGFPAGMFALAGTFHSLYQFWIHTRTIGKLRPIEGILNTPSSHRVHHGIDPEYIDKNYAGMWMLFDRLYGTYKAEEREPTFGTVKPLASFNPLWANLEGWARILGIARRTSRVRDKLFAFVAPPEWLPEDLGGVQTVPPVDHASYEKYAVTASSSATRWVFFHFVIVLASASTLLWFYGTWPRFLSIALTAWILVSLVSLAAVIEGKRWGCLLEGARLVGGVALVVLAIGLR